MKGLFLLKCKSRKKSLSKKKMSPNHISKHNKVSSYQRSFKSKHSNLKLKDAISGKERYLKSPIFRSAQSRKRTRYTNNSMDIKCFCRYCLGFTDIVPNHCRLHPLEYVPSRQCQFPRRRSYYNSKAKECYARASYISSSDDDCKTSRACKNIGTWRKYRKPIIWTPMKSTSDPLIVQNARVLNNTMGAFNKKLVNPHTINTASTYNPYYSSFTPYTSMGGWMPSPSPFNRRATTGRVTTGLGRTLYNPSPRHYSPYNWSGYTTALSSDESDERVTYLGKKAKKKRRQKRKKPYTSDSNGSNEYNSSEHFVTRNSDEKPKNKCVQKSKEKSNINKHLSVGPINLEKKPDSTENAERLESPTKKKEQPEQKPTEMLTNKIDESEKESSTLILEKKLSTTVPSRANLSRAKKLESDINGDFSQFLQSMRSIRDKNNRVRLKISRCRREDREVLKLSVQRPTSAQ